LRRIHQLVVSAAQGDAITNAALDLRAGLRRAGVASELFSAFMDPEMEGEAYLLPEFPTRGAGAELLVVHVSIGEPRLAEFLARRPEPLAVVYHNMAPAESFEPWAPSFAKLLADGRRELGALAGRTRVAVGVSAYNAAELVKIGFDPVVVAPLAVDAARLVATEPDPGMSAFLAGLGGPVVLSVGQLLPHKRVDWVLTAFYVLVNYWIPESCLVVVGADRLAGYGDAIRALVRRLGLDRVHMLGQLSQAALVSCFRAASVFMTASEHEGFCVPVLEAMAFDVPVVARDFAAVPETLAGAGLLLGATDGPCVAGEALRAVIEEPGLRESLVAAGRRRLGARPAEQARSTMLEALLGAAGDQPVVNPRGVQP
jgi:glycosyltransferase involved in cell wall biosynthesis